MTGPEPTSQLVLISPFDVLLDPNSLRLVDSPNWAPIPDEDLGSEANQQKAYEAVLSAGVSMIRQSMEMYGWLNIAPLLLRRLSDGRHVAVDGNRRLVAWRGASAARPAGGDPPAAEALISHATDETEHLQQWIRHWLTPAEWTHLGFALWRERLSRSASRMAALRPEVKREVAIDVKALALARVFESAYPGSGLFPPVFAVLREAVARGKVSQWLGADELSVLSGNRDRFFSWLLPREWENLDGPQPPRAAISSMSGVRLLGAMLDSPEMLARLDSGDVIGDLPRPTEAHEASFEPATEHPWALVEPAAPVALRSVTINRYRGHVGLTLSNLGRVNLLVGVNNAGKTSVIEAVHLLSRLADPRGLLDMLRIRTRQDPEREPSWLSTLLASLHVDLAGTTDSGRPVAVSFGSQGTPADVDLATFISAWRLASSVDGLHHTTDTHLFSHRTRRTRQVEGQNVWLAPSVLHSPFASRDRSAVVEWWKASLREGSVDAILETVRMSVDPGIREIRLADESGQFIVEYDGRPPPHLDLSSYGEGLQRVVEIGLLFAAHRGGFVLIDEFETAIHTNALMGFTRLVQQLAERFQVQVFITTHSKETVDAFLFNDHRTEDIAAYLLSRGATGAIGVRRFDGPTLRRAVEVGDVDLRKL